MSSYREELCNKDERSVPFFSPFCAPGRTVDQTLFSQVASEKPVGKSTYGELNCQIAPVHYPKMNANQISDSESARDWFKDPTYAQHIAMRLSGVDESGNSPSLKLYHKVKSVEKVTSSLLQTL